MFEKIEKLRAFMQRIYWGVFGIPVTPEQERYAERTFTGDDPMPNEYRLNEYNARRVAHDENVVTVLSEPRKSRRKANVKNGQ